MSAPSMLSEALQRCIQRRLTFAAFRTPGQPVQVWAQRTPELETVDGTLLLELNQVFLLAPFDLDRAHVPFIRSDIELLFGEIGPDIDRLDECTGSSMVDHAPSVTTSKDAFLQQVTALKHACEQRTVTKVVLSRTLRAPLDPLRLPDLFINAMEVDRDTFVAMAYTPEHGLWLGASPERLVHEEEDHVRVDALAGTMPITSAPSRVAAWGAKEREEQVLVTQHVLDVFVRTDIKDVTTRGPEVMSAGPVAHLRTLVEGDLGDALLGDLVLALHPTPAICGTPMPDARRSILAHEAHDRQLYSGFWGPWNADGPTELFVNIRCLRAYGQEAQLFVGAGITAGSDAEQEWTETEHKASTWLSPIAAL